MAVLRALQIVYHYGFHKQYDYILAKGDSQYVVNVLTRVWACK